MATERTWAGDEIPPDSAVIEVRVAQIEQLFHTLDPSPFHDKDLDADAEEYIVSSAKELGHDKPLALLVHLDRPFVTSEMVEAVRSAVHAYFARQSELTRRRLRQLFRIGRTSLAIGLVFLTASIAAGDWMGRRVLPQSHIAQVIRESLLIGGWVAMWRPLEIFLYGWWPIRNERRVYERLSRMPVRIVCSGGVAASTA
ncbi:MAG TPA: hypothetical protein VLG15_13565 [Thermoanaerobaculia bacterium]|nr:hypothetical protein [Thermoanaerobaculia bacterium]